jgi:hypothetical protein
MARTNGRSLQFNPVARLLREIEDLIRARHGVLPATDDCDAYLLPVAQIFRIRAERTAGIVYARGSHAAPARPDVSATVTTMLRQWCGRWAPEVSRETCTEISHEACRNGRRLPRGDALARRLRLGYAERQRLDIRLIGAHDVNRKQRAALAAERKRERDRRRAAVKRRQQGRMSRAEYEAGSVNRQKPWKALGISRATYFRQQRAKGEAEIEEPAATVMNAALFDRLFGSKRIPTTWRH